MKDYAGSEIRNVAVLSHDGAGKTAVVETLLATCGAIDGVGKGVDNKHVLDNEPEEIKRNVTIQMGIAPCEWKGYKMNFIDTPGYGEFSGEVRAALRACDGILIVVSAESGVEVDTERAWAYGDELHLPRMVFINKMDAEQANFTKTLESMRDIFGKSIMPLHLPMGEGAKFHGIVDIVKMKATVWEDGKETEMDVPAEYMEQAEKVREMAIEAAAEGDDILLEKYLEGGELTVEEIRLGLREGMKSGRVCPVMIGSALARIGMDKVLDRMIRYMPDASARIMEGTNPNTEAKVTVHADNPFSAFVFKTVLDPFAGKMSYVRIVSGVLNEGDKLVNQTQRITERFTKMYTLVGKQQIPMASAKAGDIVVIPKLEARTGDTFSDPGFPVVYDQIRFPAPLYIVAVEPESKGEEEKLSAGLMKLSEEDPTLIVVKDAETRQTLVYAMGEIHLQHNLAKLERKYGTRARLVEPKVPYRETILGQAESEGKHKKQSGGHGQYGHVFIRIEPIPGQGFEFVDDIFGGAVPRQYIPAVEKGARETLEKGLIAGYPMIDVRVTLYDGSYHSVDSSEMAFKVAAALALKKAVPQAQPVLLEPVYNVNVFVPDEYMGAIVGDLSSKGGRILGMEQADREGHSVVRAQVALGKMFSYVTELRSLTQGRGTYNMEFYQYEQVPYQEAEKIIAAYQAGDDE